MFAPRINYNVLNNPQWSKDFQNHSNSLKTTPKSLKMGGDKFIGVIWLVMLIFPTLPVGRSDTYSWFL